MDRAALGKSILGCILKNNSKLEEVEQHITAKHFGSYTDRKLFEVISAAIHKGKQVDAITIELFIEGVDLKTDSPLTYIDQLIKDNVSSAMAVSHAKVLAELYKENEYQALIEKAASGDEVSRRQLKDFDVSTDDNSQTINDEPLKVRPKLAPEAYHGFTKDIINGLCDGTEVVPELALMSFLTRLICSIPRNKVYMDYGNEKTSLVCYFLAIAGTSDGKGITEKSVSKVFDWADDVAEMLNQETPSRAQKLHKGLKKLTAPSHSGGLSSGEGFIYAIRDDVHGEDGEVLIQGVKDKRLLVVENEFANVFKQFKRPDNTLSVHLRNNFDYIPLHPLTKSNRTSCEEPRACILGHITPEELIHDLEDKSVTNGELNRFFLGMSSRSKPQPIPKTFPEELKSVFGEMIQKCLDQVNSKEEFKLVFDEEAEEVWCRDYVQIKSKNPPRIEKFLLARQLHYYKMFAMLFAVIDGTQLINVKHLSAAKALINWNEASIKYIFNTEIAEMNSNKNDDFDKKILDTIKGLTTEDSYTTRSEIQRKIRVKGDELKASIERLEGRSPPPIEVKQVGNNAFHIYCI